MFKKLKDKLAEEVKSSPSRIQQLAQVAQAAVSSASSTTSETVPANDNFFSITEEDTPQNSPLRYASSTNAVTTPGSVGNLQPNNTGNFLNNGVNSAPRTRKLSNSSLASDVSFRLPTYDPTPGTLNFQSDLDASASEIEESGAIAYGVQLDVISKEKLYDAYKKALDRYQKYRARYTEIVRRYRDLERDNNKARAVLVETQDKALRRISELREQCNLEQQAKAHLESALRLDMDEQDCVIKTLKTKLSLLGENPDEVLKNEKGSLIDIDSEKLQSVVNTTNDLININEDSIHNSSHIAAGASIIINESEEKIRHLESQVNKLKEHINEEKSKVIIKIEELSQLNKKFDESQSKIRELLAREEDNNILLAENKLMLHTELENKEKELKSTKQRLTQIETEHKQLVTEKDSLNKSLLKLKQEETKSSVKVRDLLDDKKRMEQKFAEFEKIKISFDTDIKELQAKSIIAESERQTLLKSHHKELETIKNLNNELQKTIDSLKASTNKTVNEETDRLRTALRQIEDAHSEARAQAQANIKTLEASLHDQTVLVTKLEKEIEEAQQREKILEDKADGLDYRLSSTLAQLNSQSDQRTERINVAFQDQIASYTARIDELYLKTETTEKEKTQLLENLNQKTNELQTSLEEKQVLLQEIDSYKSKYTQLNEEQVKKLLEHEENEKRIAKEAELQELMIKENEELKSRVNSLTAEIEKLVNDNSESKAFIVLETAMKNDIKSLNSKIEQLENQLKLSQKEKDDSATDGAALKAKVDGLKHEKNDLEKTLEKEIREKTELQNQVVNILQEIGRLENQLKEVQQSHADIEHEKQVLEEKTQKIKHAQQEAKQTAEREQIGVLEKHLEQLETRVKKIQNAKSQLAEKNTILEETNAKLQNASKENKLKIKELNNQIVNLQLSNTELNAKLKEADERLFEIDNQKSDENEDIKNQLNEKQNEIERLMLSEKALHEGLAGLKSQNQQLDNLQEEKERLTTICDELKIEIEKIREENGELLTQRDHLDEQLKQKELALTDLQQNNATLEDKNINLQETIVELSDERDNLNKSNQVLQEKLEGVDQIKIENEYLNKSSEQFTVELSSLKSENAELHQEVGKLKEKLKSQQCELYVLEENKNKQNDTFQEKDHEIDQLKTVCLRSQTLSEELQTELKQQQNQFNSLKLLNDGLQKEISTQETTLQKLQLDYDNLKELHANETTLLQQEREQEQLGTDKQIENLRSELEQKTGNINDLEIKLKDQEKINHELAEQLTELIECKEKIVILQKEIDSSRAIINDLNKDLNAQVEKTETIEAQNTELQTQITILQNDLATKTTSPDNIDVLRRNNEQLQYQLVELRHNNEREVVALNHEIDELRENALAYLEKQRELEGVRTQNTELLAQIEQLKSFENSKRNLTDNYSMESELDGREDEVMTLKKDMHKILSEVQDVSNRNLFLEQKCENYLILEQSNERLKLQNSKLSQQLDETLVSMQHAEGISANTEFEYLRNIMFQYLTNNINSNGSTLIKVIAAVLKFSPQQTQVALEKETQRKTLMGQIQNLL